MDFQRWVADLRAVAEDCKADTAAQIEVIATEIEGAFNGANSVIRAGTAQRCSVCRRPRIGRPPKNPPAVWTCGDCTLALKQLPLPVVS